MAWLRSEQSLLHHPKTVHLKTLLGVDVWVVIGKLHMLWWWCLDYAIDGDLSRKEVKVIEDACKIPLKLLVRSGFIDSRPYRRIHDWWQIQGNYFKIRYRDQPEIWQRIRDSYEKDLPMGKHTGKHMGKTVGNPMDVDRGRTDVEYGRTDVKKFTRARAAVAGSGPSAPPAPPPRVKIDNDEPQKELGHADFLKLSHVSSDLPRNEFDWAHLERKMDNVERVQSKMREKLYRDKKWN